MKYILLAVLVLFSSDVFALKLVDATKPHCQQVDIQRQLKDKIIKDGASKLSWIEKRQQKLLIAKLENFKEVGEFYPSLNYDLADTLMNIKISENIRDEDVIICSFEQGKSSLYMLIYPYLGNYKVNIFGLGAKSLEFEYQP